MRKLYEILITLLSNREGKVRINRETFPLVQMVAALLGKTSRLSLMLKLKTKLENEDRSSCSHAGAWERVSIQELKRTS